MYCKKKEIFNVLLGVQTFHVYKNSKNLKKDGNLRSPHPQISLKQFSNNFENVVYFFLLCSGVEKLLRIFAKQYNL